jgi:CubicO group peptidase (beta-lactamase class C family)
MLEVQGKLKVTDRICAYIPECPSAWAVITIKELLTHTSGIPDYTALPDFVDYEGQPSTPLQIIAHFRDLPLDFAPGTTFSYDNSGYILLGYIIEQASGLSYEAFLRKNIFTPLNLSDTGYNHNSNGVAIGYNNGSATPAEPVDPTIPYAAGALYSTVEDMNRWEQALTTDELLPAASRAEMFATQVATTEGAGYGYGFFIGTGVIFHTGAIPGFVSMEARYTVNDVTVIILSNQFDVDEQDILGGIWTKIFNAEP